MMLGVLPWAQRSSSSPFNQVSLLTSKCIRLIKGKQLLQAFLEKKKKNKGQRATKGFPLKLKFLEFSDDGNVK